MFPQLGGAGVKVVTLESLQERFPEAEFPPKVDCPRCHGAGMYTDRDGDALPCYCLFWPEDEMELAREAMDALAETAGHIRTRTWPLV